MANNSYQTTTQSSPRKIKDKWYNRAGRFIVKAVSRFFTLIKFVIRILWDIVSHVMSTITFFFSFFLKTVADPSFPSIVAIIFFSLVVIGTGIQWWQMGLWLGNALNFPGLFGVEMGVVSLLFGVGVNTFQLAPQLWKLRRSFGKAFLNLNVDVEFEAPEEPSVKDRQLNWFSYDHKGMKVGRKLSYAVEACLIGVYVAIAQSFSLVGIASGAFSLLLPEQSIEILLHTLSLMNAVSEEIDKETEVKTERSELI